MNEIDRAIEVLQHPGAYIKFFEGIGVTYHADMVRAFELAIAALREQAAAWNRRTEGGQDNA